MLNSKKASNQTVFLLLALFVCLSQKIASAENPKNVIMINPMALVGSNISPEYEYAVTDYFGLGLRANVVVNWEWKGGKDSSKTDDDYDWIYIVNGIGAGLSARLYPFGEAPKGFYLGPRCDFISFRGTYEDRIHAKEPIDTALKLGTAHLEIGYKAIISDRIALGLFADAGYAFAEAPDASSLLALTYIVGGGIYLGYAF